MASIVTAVTLLGCTAPSSGSGSPALTSPPAPSSTAAPSEARQSTAPSSTPESGPSWVDAGVLATARLATRVARLGDGSAVVVGDDNICTPGGTWADSALTEVGVPASAAWAKTPSLPKPRDRFLLLTLGDGSALVVGGTSATADTGGGRSFSSTFRLAPDGAAWQRSGDLNTARSAPAGAVLADGRVLVAGGYYADGSLRMLRSAEVFSPSTGTWSQTGPLATARYGATAVTLADGRVLIAGGWADVIDDTAAPLYGSHALLASTEVYDPATGTWSAQGDLAAGVAEATVATLPDGGALLVNGLTVSRFDPKTGNWATAASMIDGFRSRTFVALPTGPCLRPAA